MSQGNRIRIRENGPLLCTGDIEVYAENGYLFAKADDVALCRCGASKNRPFCDGSHREVGFESDGIFDDIDPVELQAEGPLVITLYDNAGIVARGPMTIEPADGSSVTRNEAVFCRCGHSANKPFCDISHKDFDFEA
ncbi:MAG: CDGSH iron-sulfur domain-containing protein [Gammaproteobacteria bacterium]|jgi:CDGSH-type Zn-finger protein